MAGNIRMSDAGEWLVTGVSPDVASAFLRKHAPWRMEVNFDGIVSSQFGQYQPYNRTPLSKLREVLKFVPDANLREGQILDIGFNAGYNSLYMAQQYGARVTGIDVVEKHKRTAEDLASILGLSADFILESAESFERRETFDLVLHFGTLYHLANPVMSIDKCVRSLKRGGWFALETMCYRAERDLSACKWIYGFEGDKTNFWSLGEEAIRSMVVRNGITQFKIISEAWPPAYKRKHSRTIWVGKKEQ
jgi:2-polyprenyl-3-methyl-5-hydroxy-6-metoxy-1,4-benzoquinol methylase